MQDTLYLLIFLWLCLFCVIFRQNYFFGRYSQRMHQQGKPTRIFEHLKMKFFTFQAEEMHRKLFRLAPKIITHEEKQLLLSMDAYYLLYFFAKV